MIYLFIIIFTLVGLNKINQVPSRHLIKNQYQGLEFDGEVFFTNSLLPQSMTILHSALQKESFLGNEKKKNKININPIIN